MNTGFRGASNFCLALLIGAAVSLVACRKELISESDARNAALKEIENAQSVLKIDVKKLPSLTLGDTTDGFNYSIWDESQNISIFVHVSPTGVAEVSWLSIEEERRRNERALKLLTSPTPSN
jgi:hypothetical protein